MSRTTRFVSLACCLCLMLSQVGRAQTEDPDNRQTPSQRMRNIIDTVDIQGATARSAFSWWSTTTGIPLVMDWTGMEGEGLSGDTVIHLELHRVPAGQVLALLLQQLSPEQAMIYESTAWYVQVMTKTQANKSPITRVYDIADLLHEIPSFASAPSFDLNQALSNTNSGGSNPNASGGSGNSGGQSLFGTGEVQEEKTKTKAERAEEVVQMIRETIEPDVWVDNGGTATIKYYNGRIIVTAPRYVQTQIGLPVSGARSFPALRRSGAESYGVTIVRPPAKPSDVAGIQTDPPAPVSGKQNSK